MGGCRKDPYLGKFLWNREGIGGGEKCLKGGGYGKISSNKKNELLSYDGGEVILNPIGWRRGRSNHCGMQREGGIFNFLRLQGQQVMDLFRNDWLWSYIFTDVLTFLCTALLPKLPQSNLEDTLLFHIFSHVSHICKPDPWSSLVHAV